LFDKYRNSKEKKTMKIPTHSDIATGVLTVRKVAEYLRVHQTTIYRLLKEQKLPAMGGRDRAGLAFTELLASAPKVAASVRSIRHLKRDVHFNPALRNSASKRSAPPRLLKGSFFGPGRVNSGLSRITSRASARASSFRPSST
jgi:hypothetical protein